MKFSTVGQGGPIAGVTFSCFSQSVSKGLRKRKPERGKLTILGVIQYVFLLNSTVSANFLKFFLQFWTHIWVSGCGKSDSNGCDIVLVMEALEAAGAHDGDGWH